MRPLTLCGHLNRMLPTIESVCTCAVMMAAVLTHFWIWSGKRWITKMYEAKATAANEPAAGHRASSAVARAQACGRGMR